MAKEKARNAPSTRAKKLRTSGSETPYTPGMFPRRKGNCYGFAVNRATPNTKLQPGNMANVRRDGSSPAMARDPSSSCAAIASKMRLDARGGKGMYESSANERCRKGFYKVASVLDPGSDFHYYRQMGDVSFRPARGASRASVAAAFGVASSKVTMHRGGSATVKSPGVWAHKRGLATGALLADSCGKPIMDPRKACRMYGNLDYEKFCGFWCVLAKKAVAASKASGRVSTRTRARRS